MPNLYDQAVSPGGTNRNNYGGTIGNRFALAANGYLRTVSFWCAIDSGTRPGFNVWNNTSNLRLQKLVGTFTWAGTAPGWFTYTLTESESTSIGQITANTTWELDLIVASGGVTWHEGCNTPDNVTDFSYEGARYGGSSSVIADSTAGAPWGISVGVAETAGGDPSTPPPTGATTADLAAWLSNDSATNTHQSDGLPWQTKVDTADTRTKVTNGLNLTGGLQALSDSLAHTIQMASDYFAGRTATYFTDLKNRLIGTSGGGGSAFFGPGGTQVSEGVETLLAQNVNATQLGAEIAKLREELTLSPDLTDTSRWTLVDTVTGEGDALVELQADLYRVSIGDAAGTHGPQLIAGVEWRPRWGWVAPRIHGCYLQRQPLVDLSPIAVAPGLFMDGLLLYSHPGFTWTVEAFVLDRS